MEQNEVLGKPKFGTNDMLRPEWSHKPRSTHQTNLAKKTTPDPSQTQEKNQVKSE